MSFSPILLFHICAGTLGFLSGAMAVSFSKGSRRHGLAGNVFVISMLSMSASGVYLAFMKSQPGNVLGGTLTFYLVATAWMTARRGDGETGILDWGALLVSLAVGAVTKAWISRWALLFLGSVALLGATGDVRMLVRSGISGTQHIARHL
jgi:hypothetical protein